MRGCLVKYIIDNGGIIHLIGIGGVSMSSLAKAIIFAGGSVTGSDRVKSEATESLEKLGIKIYYEHSPKNVESAALVIATAAIHNDNPEIVRAKELGIPVMTRAAAWGEIMRDYRQRLCISGTHGKTTTTSMAACAALAAGMNPTVMLGGELAEIGGSFRNGAKDLFIAESCEYCNSFHSFSPTVTVILNIEMDHPDFFKDIDDVIDSFKVFARQTSENGIVIANRDDKNVMAAVKGIDRNVVTFGMNENADVYAANLECKNGYYSFEIIANGDKYAEICLNVPGIHNVYNTLACCAAMKFLGVSGEMFKQGIEGFRGAKRRFEKRGDINGAVIIDDYAHHPGEIKATLEAARKMDFERVFCIFQPHTYSRTKALLGDFVSALSLADVPVITEVFAARETNEEGFTAKTIADRLENAEFFANFEDICGFIAKNARKGDAVITMGAGNVREVGDMLIERSKLARA